MKKYVAVTIGPIGDTMALAASPVSLWASSYLFSYLAKTLCRVLTEHGVAERNIITPYYRHDEPLLCQEDGVGLFHDRIVFEPGEFDLADFDVVRRAAIAEVAVAFELDPNYLLGYLRIEAAVFEAENPVAEGNILLDSFELARPFVTEEAVNPFRCCSAVTARAATATFDGFRRLRNCAIFNFAPLMARLRRSGTSSQQERALCDTATMPLSEPTATGCTVSWKIWRTMRQSVASLIRVLSIVRRSPHWSRSTTVSPSIPVVTTCSPSFRAKASAERI